jgi:hypothetical protein
MRTIGDVDGARDVLISSRRFDAGAGRVYVYSGRTRARLQTRTRASASGPRTWAVTSMRTESVIRARVRAGQPAGPDPAEEDLLVPLAEPPRPQDLVAFKERYRPPSLEEIDPTFTHD